MPPPDAMAYGDPVVKSPGVVRVARWPMGRSFGLFLSHDVDQIHDREFWRVVADVNHLRRRILYREAGNSWLAMRRIGRSLFRPKHPLTDFETILELERRHGVRSTFFILDDRYWARHGARFRIADPRVHDLVVLLAGAKCEIGVHGGYYRFNDARAYRQSRGAFLETFGVEPQGIRNHLLRLSVPDTWAAQARAGFLYDATFGEPRKLGPRDGRCLPFWAVAPTGASNDGLLELPLTVMDTTLFRYSGLGGDLALDAAWAAVAPVVEAGGLVTLLWHNNFFNEPEYWDWQWVYEQLLDRLAALKPWCATGAEINNWWRTREGVAIVVEPTATGSEATVTGTQAIKGLVLEINEVGATGFVSDGGAIHEQRVHQGWRIFLPPLGAGARIRIRWDRSA